MTELSGFSPESAYPLSTTQRRPATEIGAFALYGDAPGAGSTGRYVTSADFAVDAAENWQSEYLQFLLFIVVAVWLVQRGSSESKTLDRALYSRSFGVAMGTIFVLSWLAQSIAGASDYNEQRLRQLQDPVP